MSEKWLTCFIFKGMFSDEMAVKYGDLSFFVPKSSVSPMTPDRGKVRVRVFEKKNKTWAVLPTDDQAIIPVEREDLVAT